MSNDGHTNEQPEWMDLRAIRRYACVSKERFASGYIDQSIPFLRSVLERRNLFAERFWMRGWSPSGEKDLTWTFCGQLVLA